jgi:hypothetical protein
VNDKDLADEGYFWVYIIAPEHGWPVKIGYSRNLVTRLGALQVGCYERLRLQKKYLVRTKSRAIRMERLIHKKLDLSGKNRRGEWFNIFVDDAITVAEEAFSYQEKLAALKDKENWDEEKLSFYGYIE